MEFRKLPGTEIALSAVGMSFPAHTELLAPPSALLKAAIDGGVRLFDVVWSESIGAGADLFPTGPAIGGPWVLTVGIDPSAPVALPKTPSLARSGRVLLPIVRRPSEDQLRSTEFVRRIEHVVAELGAPVWGAAWNSMTDAAIAGPKAIEAGARILVLPGNLLAHGELGTLGAMAHDSGAAVIALDPFASGALDGSFLTLSPLDVRRPTRPSTMAELSERFGLVAQLGFLTEGRRRTLAQSAVRFVLDLPGVVAAFCEFRSPRTLLDLTRIESVPPLTDSELESLAHLQAVGRQ